MNITFKLAWLKPGKNSKQAFKNPHFGALFFDYIERIEKFCSCEVSGATKSQPQVIWLCDLSQSAKTLNSEQVAAQLKKHYEGSVKDLEIWIGPPDGFLAEDIARLKPQLIWAFGPITLPHELAAVVASEQVYRAWTILKKLPYHLGH